MYPGRPSDPAGTPPLLPVLGRAFSENPFPFYSSLRQPGRPAVLVRLPGGAEAWLVLDYSVARALLRDTRLANDPGKVRSLRDGRGEPDAPSAPPPIYRHLLTLDPPEHTRLRALVARRFGPSAIARRRSAVEAIAHRLLDAVDPGTTEDLVTAYALPLPLAVICEIVGVPEADRDRIARASAALLAADLESPEQVDDVAEELTTYLRSLGASGADALDGSVAADLRAACDAGQLSDDERIGLLFLLLMAGHETSVGFLASAVVTLLRRSDAWAAIARRPDGTARIVDELLRLESPLQTATVRFALQDIEIDDVVIPAGASVFVGLGAANHDRQQFESPERLCPGRSGTAAHLAFGFGPHYCLGAPLARLEAEVGIATLARRFPRLELATDPSDLDWVPGLILRGLYRLPVHFRAGPPVKESPSS